MSAVGPIGRLGRLTATHVRAVVLTWVAIAVVFGAFAPRVETALSGAGWQANGSQSVQARAVIQKHFAGQSSGALMVVVHSARLRAPLPLSPPPSRGRSGSCAPTRRSPRSCRRGPASRSRRTATPRS